VPESFDVAVIGGGPGGYVAAIRAAQLGARVALAEKERLGGTCLVKGCIPTKALLQSSELYHTLRRHGRELGVMAESIRFDLPAAQARRVKVVDGLVNGVGSLLKANGVTVLEGGATLAKAGKFSVRGSDYQAQNTVIATGSAASRLPVPGGELTIDSDGILELQQVPETMTVIGGGVVGMEWGALYAALGTKVTVIEMLPQILPSVESDLIGLYSKHFQGLGGAIHTDARVDSVKKARRGLTVSFTAGGEKQQIDSAVVLRATGRVPYTDKLGLEAAGVETERGRVKVDGQLGTSAEGIWAIGDVIGGIMLAHVASYEGVCAVENIVARAGRRADYRAAPNCIYTDPEIAHVGLGEKEAREQGFEVKLGKFPFAASARAMTLGQTEGAVKVILDARDDTILGVHMVGPRVTDVAAEATLAVQQRLKLHDLDLTIHAHPTLAESLLQAALAADGRAIEIPNRRRPAPAAGAASTGEEPVSSSVETKQTNSRNGVAHVEGVNPAKLELKKQNKVELLKLYRMMYLIRRFEERAQVEYTRAKIGGYCHLNLGEEATVVGGVLALKPQDYIYTSYREHGHAIARGLDPKAVMAELFGREGGVAHGRGGSMHIFDYDARFMGGYGIVGGHLPVAVGAAFASRYAKSAEVTFCMFGDGATNIGAFHESLNFSKVFKLPVVWFCVNNQYGMGTAVDRASAISDIYRKACAYDMESIRIDGNDVVEVLRKTSEIVEKTRQDLEPRFIEAVNYRFKGHSVVDPDKYRDADEKARWSKSDPIGLYEHRLTAARIAAEEDLKEIRDEVEAEVDAAVKYADESPNPPVAELFRYLYAGEFETVSTNA